MDVAQLREPLAVLRATGDRFDGDQHFEIGHHHWDPADPCGANTGGQLLVAGHASRVPDHVETAEPADQIEDLLTADVRGRRHRR